MDDQTLITKILARDRHALLVFYRTYTPKLRLFIRSKVANPEDAEEVLQDALFAFLEAIRDFTGASKLKTFLYAIANHKVIDWYRRKKIRHVVFSAVPQLETIVTTLIGPEEELDAALLREKIYKALGRLLPLYKSVLILKYADDFSVEDIARKLAISFKSAESQLFRARKAFVQAFLAI
ncbi:MAG: RNA polymerase sigma factor [Candidatus Gottesmanbacteria bacterium]|nr:RNA polymerase sigma factor [Candidatus Gottesmanbacteria bacterium]